MSTRIINKGIKKRKNIYKSSIADHFDSIYINNVRHLVCIHCKKFTFKYEEGGPVSSGTGWRHLADSDNECHQLCNIDWIEIQSLRSKKSTLIQINQQQFNSLLLEFIIKDNQPFNVIENQSFINILKGLRPDINIPGADTIRNRVTNQYIDCKKILKAHFRDHNGKISFTFDGYSNKEKSFLGITAHWIDNKFNNHSVLLGLEDVDGCKQGVALCKLFIRVTDEYDITNKILCTTSDNGSNNGTMVEELIQTTRQLGIDYNGFNGGHILCINHIINLAIKSFLSDAMIMPIIEKINNYGHMVKVTDKTLKNFFNIFTIINFDKKPLKPKVFNEIRWSSAYLMVNRALYLMPAIKYDMLNNKKVSHLVLSDQEWDTLEEIKQFLFQVDDSTLIAQNKYTNLSMALPIYNSLMDLAEQVKGTSIIKEGARKFWKEISGYYSTAESGIEPFYLSSFLNPSIILSLFQSDNWKSYKLKINEHINKVFIRYGGNNSTTTINPISETNAAQRLIASQRIIHKKEKISNELTKYKNLPPQEYFDFEKTLSFWKSNQNEYPVLSRMARDYLSIQISSTPSERSFRNISDILTKNRQSTSKITIKELACTDSMLQLDFIKQSTLPINI